MSLPNAIRMGLAALLACMLSACWISDKPLITQKNASVIPFAGRYHATDEDRGALVIRAQGAKAYVLEDRDSAIPTRFLRLRDDWYLVQYEGDDSEFDSGEVFYIYQIIRFAHGQLSIYAPECAEIGGSYSGMKRGEDSEICNFSKLKGLTTIAAAYIGKLESGEISHDPAIWNREEIVL